MNRLPRLTLALLTPFVLAWSASSFAANCTNGKNIYSKTVSGFAVSCSQASCHGTNPASNKNNILTGAGNALAIDSALDSVADMSGLRAALMLTPTDLDDIAEYLFFAGAGQACPAGTPSVAANPTAASFGNQSVGTSSAGQTITITNSGTGSASGMTYPAAPTHFSRTTTCAATLAAGASCSITFTFSPTAAGTFTPTFTVTGTGGISVPIALSGTGVATSPNVNAAPTSLAFGSVTVGTTSSTQTITVSNTGTAAATNMAYPAAPAKFNKSGTCGSATLAAGASCTVVFSYSPTATVTDSPTYTITGGGSTLNIALSGTGVAAAAPNVSAAPTSLAFGSVTVGTTSSTQTITVSNTGAAAATNMAYPAAPAKFNKSGTCSSATLAAGASCTVVFSYSPTATVTDSPTYTITGGGSTLNIALSGTGVAAAAPNVSAAPTSLAFGNVTVGTTSSTQTITVSNTGTAAATNMAYPAAPANFNKSGTCSSATLAAGATCTVVFSYSPTATVTDSPTYTITGGGSTLNIALSGTGVAAAAPNVSAAPTSLAFGSVTVGTTSSTQTITVSNTGAAAATNMTYPAAPANFNKSGTCSSATLAAGATCSVVFSYSPTATVTDSPTYTITGGGSTLNIALSGTGVAAAAPNVSASPASFSFGTVMVGTTSAAQTLTISNTGGAAATGMGIANGNAARFPISSNTCGASLAAGASCTLNVAYAPSAAVADNASLTISYAGGTPIVVGMSGTGTSASVPNLQASPSSAAFGSVVVGQTSGTQPITITNSGAGAASGVAISNPNAAEFLVSGNTCGATLAAGASCTFSLAYSPSGVGADNVTLSVNYSGGSATVAMTGTGTAPPSATLQASPSSLAFGTVTVGTTSAAQTLTISNTGGASATGLGLANDNAARFPISSSTCGASLAAGASCTLNVAYAPSAAVTDNANLTISYSGGTPIPVAMSGTGTATASPSMGVDSPPPHGSVAVGSTKDVTYTFNNSGTAIASGLAFSGLSGAWSSAGGTCGTSLAAGASCTYIVRFAPAAPGAASATLTVSYTGGAAITVALSGTGTAAPTPNLALDSPPAHGNVVVGSYKDVTYTITNGGGAAASNVVFGALTGEWSPSGGTCGAALAAGASCTYIVRFTPADAGAESATLSLTYTGGAASTALSATGVASAPGAGQLSMPAAVTLPAQAVGTTGAAQTVTLSNVGSAAVTVTSIASSNAAEFTIGASTCATVNAGASCTFGVTFTPSAAGGRTATITVTSNGTGSPQTIAASGNGTGGTPPPGGTTTMAIEYYHRDFDHYFITSIADEITKLDNGTFAGWTRTGKSFKVSAAKAAGLDTVCRFFSTAFGLKSSHFYTNYAPECTVLKSNPNWQLEAEDVFAIPSPDFDGNCPANTVPVYRMYNNGQGGAPNHRFTTDLIVRGQMLLLGWIPEGQGKIGVMMCAPQ